MPGALRSEPWRGRVWRLVEAQHLVSTMPLVDSLDEQRLLEDILERSKPPVPPACAHLHYLIAAPFRYGCYPADSRFRRRGRTPGVFYGAEQPLTAVAETVWHRFRFFDASPDTPLPARAAEFTGFACRIDVPFAVDLTAPPLSARAAAWTDPEDYTACLALADQARAEGIEAIRYASVRDPDGGIAVAVLTCRGFALPRSEALQSWRILFRPGRARVIREHPRLAMELAIDGSRLARIA